MATKRTSSPTGLGAASVRPGRPDKPPVSKTKPGVGVAPPSRAPSAEQATFDWLRVMLLRNTLGLVVKKDTPGDVCLVSRKAHQGKELVFGALQSKKTFVSYHLLPVEMNPALLDGISPDLKRRMQGKSSFTFTRVDEALLNEVAELTKRGFEEWKEKGLV
jgi:hypothetical protein